MLNTKMFNKKKYEVKETVKSVNGERITTYSIHLVIRNIFGKIVVDRQKQTSITSLIEKKDGSYEADPHTKITSRHVAMMEAASLNNPLPKYKGFEIKKVYLNKEDVFLPYFFIKSKKYIAYGDKLHVFDSLIEIMKYIDENKEFVISEKFI